MVRAYIYGVPGMVQVVEISHTRGKAAMYLTPEAAEGWERMCIAAGAEGVTLVANSAWRSFDSQQRLFDRWSSAYAAWERARSGPRPPRPAQPGFSKHHNAICVDIQRGHDDPDGAGPEIGAVDKFLEARAHEFGFVANVPGEKWHYEFRGIPR